MNVASTLPAQDRAAGLSRQFFRRGLLITALAIGAIPIFRSVGSMVWFHEYLGDYKVFWGIATAPVEWSYGHFKPVFAYPPPALVLIRPFGLLPFWSSLIAWGAAGSSAMIFAARKIMPGRAIAIGFTTCAAVEVIVEGQTSFFIGALVIAALSASHARWRGGLLAVAALVKPQSLVAAPVALLARRDWRAMVWAAGAGSGFVVLTLLFFGVDSWLRWASMLGEFHAWLVSHGIDANDVGIYGLARSNGFSGWIFVLGIPLGLLTTWLAFRRDASIIDRYAAFGVSSVLLSPYTLGYDLAGLTFACVAMLLDRGRSPWVWLGAALIVSSVFAAPGIILLALRLSYEAAQRSS